MKTITDSKEFEWLVADYAWLLILLALLLFSTKTLFNIPMGCMSLAGIYIVFSSPRNILVSPPARFILAAFLLIWVPMLCSLVGAENLQRSSETVLLYLHYPLAAIFIATCIRTGRTRNLLHAGIFIIVAFWCIDAMIQFLAGKDLFGYPYVPPQLTGMFYPKVRLGYIAAVLSPFMFEYVRLNFRRMPWLILIIIPLVATVLLSGKRVAWLMLMIAVFIYLVFLWVVTRKKGAPWFFFTTVIVGLVTVILLYTSHQPFHNRVDQTLGIFSNDYEQADAASARRLDLWKTSIAIYRDNWINGVGPRNYRFTFENYADTNNFWMKNGRSGQTHPHLFLMEIAAETGTIGIAGYVLFWLYLFRIMRREMKSGNENHITWSLCVMIALFPLNAHLAFYGSYWSSFMWLVLSISSACLSQGKEQQE